MDDDDSPVDLSKHHQSRANLLPLLRVRGDTGDTGMDETRDLKLYFLSFSNLYNKCLVYNEVVCY